MYQVNDLVLYGVEGVCQVLGKTVRRFGDRAVEYYVLKSCDQHTTTYVPTDNETLVNKMRRLLTKREVLELIHDMPDETTIWIDDASARAVRYQQILMGDDRREIVRMIKTLYLHKQALKDEKRKMHIADERFLRDGEKRLHDEFAQVLDMKDDEVIQFIYSRVEAE